MWNRTRQIVHIPFLTRTTPQAAPPMAQQNQIAPAEAATGKDKKTSEPLFGPSIGSVSSGPAWTMSSEKKVLTDELTPDIVSSWIEKSKQPSQPTTTLQALVNLKRPTLRLSPLTTVHEDTSIPHAADLHHHGLEFEYDCDAPKCGIYVHVYLPKTHPDAPPTSSHQSLSKLLVFETVIDGGFGNRLKLEEGALLELGRFENAHVPANAVESSPSGEVSSSGDQATNLPSSEAMSSRRRRFSHFSFRRRSQNRSVSGPALAVVDAEPVVAQEGKPIKEGKEDTEEGVRLTIRLAALDEQCTELLSPNEQITYLHIVRFGQKSTEVAEGGNPSEDTRPWVVKVVKREATIGPHTFHLHEIFGLTASSSHKPPPTASHPSATHTYPPDEIQQAPVVQADDEDPQSECLLCLSSPREVVLLPCRHLVACKDCALNMVEFGAGGNITQPTELPVDGEVTPGAPVASDGGFISATTAATAASPAPVVNQRRKRKAKGWFCPVCRQPYTSMLRLTTAPPPVSESKDAEGSGTEDEGTAPDHLPTVEVRSGGLLGGALRPGFLRGFSLSRPQPADVENQAGARV